MTQSLSDKLRPGSSWDTLPEISTPRQLPPAAATDGASEVRTGCVGPTRGEGMHEGG